MGLQSSLSPCHPTDELTIRMDVELAASDTAIRSTKAAPDQHSSLACIWTNSEEDRDMSPMQDSSVACTEGFSRLNSHIGDDVAVKPHKDEVNY
jgi:hypothetical protein